MPGKDTIQVEGTVRESLPKIIYRVELPNGHRILAHVSREMRLRCNSIGPGDKVTVEMSPYDFSKGCITSKHE